MPTHTDPEFIGSAEVCRIHNVHPSTVSRWVSNGDLTPVHKLPGKNGAFVFNRADVEQFAADRSEQTA